MKHALMPRSEYPRPQFVRPEWLCLNGEWQFEMDAGDSGRERGLARRPLRDRITVPFCPESVLSGIGHTDFMNAVWYRREVAVPPEWAGRRVLSVESPGVRLVAVSRLGSAMLPTAALVVQEGVVDRHPDQVHERGHEHLLAGAGHPDGASPERLSDRRPQPGRASAGRYSGRL